MQSTSGDDATGDRFVVVPRLLDPWYLAPNSTLTSGRLRPPLQVGVVVWLHFPAASLRCLVRRVSGHYGGRGEFEQLARRAALAPLVVGVAAVLALHI